MGKYPLLCPVRVLHTPQDPPSPDVSFLCRIFFFCKIRLRIFYAFEKRFVNNVVPDVFSYSALDLLFAL